MGGGLARKPSAGPWEAPVLAWPGRLVSTPRFRSQVAGGETVEAHPPSRNPPPFPGSSRETCWRGELAGPKARHRRSSGPRLQTTKNHVAPVSIPSLSGLSVRLPASGPRAGWALRRGLRESPSPPSPPYRRRGAGSSLNKHDGGRVEFPAKWAFVSVFKERPGGSWLCADRKVVENALEARPGRARLD